MSQKSKKVIVCDTISGAYYGTLNSFDSGSKCVILEDAYKIFSFFGNGEDYENFTVENLIQLEINQTLKDFSYVSSRMFSNVMKEYYDDPETWKPILLFRCPTLILSNISQILFCVDESVEWLTKIIEDSKQE